MTVDKENVTTEKIDPQAKELADLPIADDRQANETKGGTGRTRLIMGDDQGVFLG